MSEVFADAKNAETAVLTRADLFEALRLCMEKHPPEGLEKAMHRDADRMAGLWAEMHLQRIDAVPVASVKREVLQAFKAWHKGGDHV
ncbi:hypothetical protein ACVNIS_24990 (plasmid) [Sphaerotilaceae bacterium SBD11-9]